MYNSVSFYLIAFWRNGECPLKFSQLQSKAGWLLIPAAVVILLVVFFLFPQQSPDAVPEATLDLIQAEPLQQTETPTLESIPEQLLVDIKGQVANPGVYELMAGARMKDAIDAAGGFLATADSRAINLAMKVEDEMVIYVPEVGEEIELPVIQASAGGSSGESLIDLNKATETELMTLTGIGPSKAAAIITYRTETGNFQKIEDLMNVTGIGEKTFEQLKDSITAK